MKTMTGDAYKILIVEDTAKHQDAASALLDGHDLTVVDCFEAACDALGGERSVERISRLAAPYNVLLTDLLYPQGPEGRMLRYNLSALDWELLVVAPKKLHCLNLSKFPLNRGSWF